MSQTCMHAYSQAVKQYMLARYDAYVEIDTCRVAHAGSDDATAKLTLEDILRVHEAKSFDYRVSV